MAKFDPPPVVAFMRADDPFEQTVGEISRVTLSTLSLQHEGRAIELSGVLIDGTRWDAVIPMPPNWRIVREADVRRVTGGGNTA